MNEKKDAPAVVRRRRKIARMQREQTPDAAVTGKLKNSDDELSSNNTNPEIKKPPTPPTRKLLPLSNQTNDHRFAGGHLSKILSRRDRKFTSNIRSLSSPRDGEQQIPISKSEEVYQLMRQARRSLSSPRNKEESSESGRSLSPQKFNEVNKQNSMKIDTNRAMTQFEKNIIKFEEERRRFVEEKKRFEKEKRELDNIRKKRLENLDKKPYSKFTYDFQRPITQLPATNEIRRNSDNIPKIPRLSLTTPDQIELKPRSPKRSDYESSTESCTSEEIADEELDIENNLIVNSDSDENIERKKEAKIEILTKWVEETKARTFDEHGEPKLVSGDFDEHLDVVKDNTPPKTDGNITENVKETNTIDEKQTNIDETDTKINENENLDLVKNEEKISEKPIDDIHKENDKSIITNNQENSKELIEKEIIDYDKISFIKSLLIDSRRIWKQLKRDYPTEIEIFHLQKNKCIADFIIITLFCGFGGLLFRFMEGSFENMYKCGVKRVKRDFVDHLWLSSHNLREDDWKSLARTKLRTFEEELQNALEAGVTSYSGMKAWTFMNSVVYCMTVITTIGYGHISPSTTTGRAITILYAIIGIPLFLILLADFGKLFTRGIKFLWAFVRRLYYTGSCRKVRKTVQVQEVMRGINMVYDIATFRRPSQIIHEENENTVSGSDKVEEGFNKPPTLAPLAQMPQLSPGSTSTNVETAPSTPAPEVFEIDDEFNLPISLACIILVGYIFIGAIVYSMWESWSFFESFYFVFISMSTIGFGDYVPQHPIYMMASIIYLVFGLALTSMCINVVQVKLSDHFRQASAKIGATIGLKMAEEEASKNSQTHTPVELASVHSTTPRNIESHPTFEFSTTPKTPTSIDSTNINIEKPKRKIFKIKKAKK